MSIPMISEATIRHHANTQSFKRGEDYYKSKAVTDLTQRKNLIQAGVEGSSASPYRVSIRFDAGGIAAACCTCPYDYDGWCKHIVATLLMCTRQPKAIESRPTLEQLLDRLDFVQTQRLVQALVAEQPELINAVECHVSQLTSFVPQKQPPAVRRTTLDVAPFRRQIKQILRDGIRELEYGYEEDPFTDDLQAVIEKAQQFTQNGDGNSAIAILEAITAAYAEEWDELLDYGGDCYAITEYLDEAWTEAILCADIPSSQAVDLRVMLEVWQDELDASFAMSLAALQQGWDYPPLQQVLEGKRLNESIWPGNRPTFADDLALVRLKILSRQERHQEYLFLASAEGLAQQYLTRLAALGQVESALAAAKTHMTTSEAALVLAKTLREKGHMTEALEIASAGLALPGNSRYDLAIWTSELAEALGDRPVAFNASIIAFTTRPSFQGYSQIEQLAEDNWPIVKQELLQTLRAYREWGAEEAKVNIFLHEGLLDEAISVVNGAALYRSDLVHRVMDAAITHRADWVIERATRSAEEIVNAGKAERYDEAVKWLQKARAAYLQSQRRSEWSTYRTDLTNTHARKRKLMELLKQGNTE